ncbi:hypothetical protein, partial [Ruminococcus sp.]|uniref:hypothetical protein n=1 Tax=Ruminococcus sp. TaxID=41978 RepID=UPI00257DD7F1
MYSHISDNRTPTDIRASPAAAKSLRSMLGGSFAHSSFLIPHSSLLPPLCNLLYNKSKLCSHSRKKFFF